MGGVADPETPEEKFGFNVFTHIVTLHQYDSTGRKIVIFPLLNLQILSTI